ncbi:MAG: SRPBCC family protein [bacterium]|jgi:uncharacterized protein YndB with AHSA1/START domain|nr:SRPBCC family protein [bacterium]
MDGFSLTTNINEPPTTVFAFLADPANMTRWYEAVEQIALRHDTPAGKGSRFQLIRSLPGGRAVNVVEVTEYEPDRRLTLESRSGPTPFRYAYTLDAVEDGTRLTLDGQISAKGLPGPAGHLGPLAARLFAQGMKRNLQTLKHLLEG